MSALECANRMADLGYKIVPIPSGQKYPKGLGEWQTKATDDRTVIEGWLTGGQFAGIGWVMGTQANGLRLVGVDVDVSDGKQGKERLAELLKEWGPEARTAFGSTVTARTGTGGYHFIFELPVDAPALTNGKLVEHVDIRGEGGFLVTAPTVHPNGEPYAWVDGKEPWALTPALAPLTLIEALTHTEEAPPRASASGFNVVHLDSHRPGSDGDTPADWARANLSINQMLNDAGWNYAETRGVDTMWTRPGKQVKDGNSAIVHDDDHLVVFSTNAPAEFFRCGRENRDGSRSLSPLQVYAAINTHGDISAASKRIRLDLMPRPEPNVPKSSTVVASEGPGEAATGLNLPDEFWESRDVLTHIRTAAWSKGSSPDAVLAGVLARYSANLHPSIMLPNWGTLDLFTIIEGHSGSGKSKASKTAAHLYPGGQDAAVMMDRNVGSGEGLAEAFFEWRDEDGAPCGASKKGARKVKTRWGLHFSTDEGTALVSSAGRIGSIIIPTLCSAWMGEAIGQLLADPSKSRMIEPNQVRVSAEVKIQTIHGWKLFAEEYASTGLAQRMLCFTALDPSIYERHQAGIPKPEWPGPITFPQQHLLSLGSDGQRPAREMTLSPTIASYLDEREAAGHNPAWAGNPLDTHSDLTRLKVAGLLALWDDRMDINDDDWHIAGLALTSHRAVRSKLQETQIQAQRDDRHTQLTAEINKEMALDNARHRALVQSTLTAIIGRINEGKPLGKKFMSKQQREVYEEVMQTLGTQGLVTETSSGWEPA